MRINSMKTSIALFSVVLGGLLNPALAVAHDARIASLHVLHPASRATLPGQNAGVVYLAIENEGATADRLLSLSTPAASGVAIHAMSMQGTTMKMREVDSLPLAPATKVSLQADSGYHIMLTGLKQPLKVGDKLPLTLVFEKAGKLDVSIHVEANPAQPRPAAASGAKDASAMPEMPAHKH